MLYSRRREAHASSPTAPSPRPTLLERTSLPFHSSDAVCPAQDFVTLVARRQHRASGVPPAVSHRGATGHPQHLATQDPAPPCCPDAIYIRPPALPRACSVCPPSPMAA